MEQITMQAVTRTAGNKGDARRLRAAGSVPAVVYGAGHEPQTISVPAAFLKKALAHMHGTNLLVNLELEGQGLISALLKSLEVEPIYHTPVSADFQLVSLTETIQVSVALAVVGDPVTGTAVDQLARELMVSCRPLDIPDQITIDVTGLAMHETRLASEIALPEGVELVGDGSEPIVTGVPEFANDTSAPAAAAEVEPAAE